MTDSATARPIAGQRPSRSVAIVGAHGNLGAALTAELRRHQDDWRVLPLTRRDCDVTHPGALRAVVGALKPDVIVNCTAFNDVDGAEDNEEGAMAVNAHAVDTLAELAADLGATLVHYSTDFVFDGVATTPYRETDPPNPASAYGRSKLLGESFALQAPASYVMRVSSLFGRVPEGPAPRGSVASIAANILNGRTVRAFDDRTVSPSSVIDVAAATRQLLTLSAQPGLYHCVSAGVCTWLELAAEAARQLSREADLVAVHVADVALRAPRPQYCALSNAKLAAAGVSMPHWRDSLGQFLTGPGGAVEVYAPTVSASGTSA